MVKIVCTDWRNLAISVDLLHGWRFNSIICIWQNAKHDWNIWTVQNLYAHSELDIECEMPQNEHLTSMLLTTTQQLMTKKEKKLVCRELWSVRWTLRLLPCWFASYSIKLSLLEIYKLSFWMRIKATTTSLLWYETLHWACDEPFITSFKAAFHNLTVFHRIPCIVPPSPPQC